MHKVAVQGGLHSLRLVLVGLQAQHDAVLLREKQVEHAVFILRCYDDFNEKLVDFLGGGQINGTIADQHATKSRNGVARQSINVSLLDSLAAGEATRIVVLEDGEGRLAELTDKVEACIKVKQVVVRQLFAVQFLEHRIKVAIEGAFLVRVFSVA